MKRFYKNNLDLSFTPDPAERRNNIDKEMMRNSEFMPKTLEYKDIDLAFKEWVEKDLKIVQDNTELPTMVLFSNQRFSEYMQSWEYTDENNNLILNFKTITRESNPSHGNLNKGCYNIPDDHFYTVKTIEALDKSGKKYFTVYKMRQPVPIDLKYTVSIITNRYETINDFNQLMNLKFKASQCYICPNGHYISMKLENISDESEYNTDDRQFFSQSFSITVLGYIITEDDLKVEEVPSVEIHCFDGDLDKHKPSVEIIENECEIPENKYYNQPASISILFDECDDDIAEFTIDTDFKSETFEYENIKAHILKIWINDDLYEGDFNKIEFKNEDVIKVKIFRPLKFRKSTIIFNGYIPNVIYNTDNDTVETPSDFNQNGLDIEVF